MTSEDHQLVDVVMGMFGELSKDLRAARDEAKRDHNAQIAAQTALDKKVSEALKLVAENQKRQDKHDEWHGKNDAKIAARIDGLSGEKHDSEVSNAAVAAYKARFRWLGEVATDARKVITVGIASSLLVAIGYVVGHI